MDISSDKRVVYVGPTLPSEGIKQYTVYVDGIPQEQTKTLLDECKLFRQLFVPVGDLSQARQNINKKGDVLNEAANELAAYRAKGAK